MILRLAAKASVEAVALRPHPRGRRLACTLQLLALLRLGLRLPALPA